MFKHILLPTDGSASAAMAIRYAAAMAEHYGAAIHGLHVIDVKLLEGPFLRDISASLGTAPYVNYQGNIAMLLEERGKSALEDLESICAKKNISCDTRQVTGIVTRAILEQSELADLIVMGRGGEHHEWLEGLAGSTTEAVVRRAELPVLLTVTDKPGFDRFLMAYDGSHHARQALKTAADIATDWKMPFHVLTAGQQESQRLLAEAEEYLQSFAVDVQYIRREGAPGEAIVAAARELEADLIVMGAYGHSRMRELVVGSTTAYVMNHTPFPLLLIR
jgi:nucleotide-binding universal stress UspA family protein